MSTCHKGLWSYGLVMGQTGGVGYAGSWWLGGVVPPLGLDLGFFPCSTPSSITSCEGEGLPAHNHTVEAVASPTWTKRQGRTDKTTLESRGGVIGVTDARGLNTVFEDQGKNDLDLADLSSCEKYEN